MKRTHSQNGSTLLVALMFLGILMAVGGATFLAVQSRYRQVHQNASWQEALHLMYRRRYIDTQFGILVPESLSTGIHRRKVPHQSME